MNKDSYLKLIDTVIENGVYKDNWESLSKHTTPKWFTDGKLGIFIHFGIYSVAGFGSEWYSRAMYDKNCREFEYHVNTFGKQDKFGYKDFIPMFKAEKFSAEEWISLFKEAGAKYVMPVSEHHDGFAMYETEFNPWNSTKMGPHRDFMAELREQCLEKGLEFCSSNHRAEHYFFMNSGKSCESDIKNGECEDFYGPADDSVDFLKLSADIYAKGASEEFLKDWMVRVVEFIDNYKPSSLYFDWWIHNLSFRPYIKKIAAYYYNRAIEWGKEVTINYKHYAFAKGCATFDVERGALTGISPDPWQTCTSVSRRSWGYIKDNDFKAPYQVICDFIDIVSKNGCMLLNVGPSPEGEIIEAEANILKELGKWLKVCGEGIYETSCWKTFGEGSTNVEAGQFKDNEDKGYTSEDFRFTYKAGNIYAFQMKPDSDTAIIKSFKKTLDDMPIKSVSLLGSSKAVSFEKTEEGLIIKDYEKPYADYPLCFKIELI